MFFLLKSGLRGPKVWFSSAASARSAWKGHVEVCHALLEGRAEQAADAAGLRPLHMAAWSGAAEVVELLMRCGASKALPTPISMSRSSRSMPF